MESCRYTSPLRVLANIFQTSIVQYPSLEQPGAWTLPSSDDIELAGPGGDIGMIIVV